MQEETLKESGPVSSDLAELQRKLEAARKMSYLPLLASARQELENAAETLVDLAISVLR